MPAVGENTKLKGSDTQENHIAVCQSLLLLLLEQFCWPHFTACFLNLEGLKKNLKCHQWHEWSCQRSCPQTRHKCWNGLLISQSVFVFGLVHSLQDFYQSSLMEYESLTKVCRHILLLNKESSSWCGTVYKQTLKEKRHSLVSLHRGLQHIAG